MTKHLLNPAFVFVMVWATVVAVSPLTDLGLYDYSERFYWYLAAGVTSFVVGVAISRILVLWETLYVFKMLRSAFSYPVGVKVYIAFMVFALAVNAYNRSIMLGEDWWNPSSVTYFRELMTNEGLTAPYPWVAYFNFFFFSAIPFLMCVKHTRLQKLIVLLLLTLFVYLSAARASIFAIALIAYFFDWQKRGFRPVLTAVVGGILVSAFLAIAFMTGKVADEGANFSMLGYAFAPSHALDQILHGVRLDQSGAVYTFSFLHGILHKLGFITDQWGLDPYFMTPLPTNVYTIFGTYVLDYGIAASFLCLGVIGIVCGVTYFASQKTKDPYLLFIYSMFLTLLCLSVFHDNFSTAGYVWASIVLGFIVFPRYNS